MKFYDSNRYVNFYDNYDFNFLKPFYIDKNMNTLLVRKTTYIIL